MNKNKEIAKLRITLIQKIKSENDVRYNNLSSDEIIKIIFDSSDSGKYSLWIIREYLKGNIHRFEDMGRVKQALILFKNNLSKFDNSQKQLNKMSFQEVEGLVEPYQDVLTQNAIKRMNKEKIWSEIDVIYSGPEGRIYSPKTEQASIFLGQGTKWCTAAVGNSNMFSNYEEGSLYVFVLSEKDKQGREIKYQLHVETGQFMDFEDKNVNVRNIQTNILLSIFYKNHLSQKYKIKEKMHKLLSNNLYFDLFINEEFESFKEKIFVEKLKLNLNVDSYHGINILNNISEKSMKNEMRQKIYEKILETKSKCITFFPKEFQTEENYMKALKHDTSFFEHFPDELKNYELCRKIVSIKGNMLKYVPENYRNHELCQAAIRQNGEAVYFVPKKLKNEHIYQQAIKSCSWIYRDVPEKFSTDAFMIEAVTNNGFVLNFIRPEKIDAKLCALAISSRPRSLRYVPDEFKTKEMCEKAFERDTSVFDCIPSNFVTENMALKFIKQYPSGLRDIPEKFITKDLITDVVKKYGDNIRYVPEKFLTKELCEMVFLNPVGTQEGDIENRSLSYIPESFLTKDFLEKLFLTNICYLEYLPKKFKTEELYQMAVKISLETKQKNILNFIPEQFVTTDLVNSFFSGAVNEKIRLVGNKNIKLQKTIVETILKKNSLNYSVEEALEMLFSLEENDFQKNFRHMKQSLSFIYMETIVDKLSVEAENKNEFIYSNQ